jgi:pyruvate/2-oxoglutarate dehydrogenase complex dihydrolipoamide dehydrogenase (E3) component
VILLQMMSSSVNKDKKVRTMADTYDLIVIGAGSGGVTAARFAAQLEAKVALVEKGRVGGDCTWTGCVPSKALLKAAKVAHQARTAAHYGLCAGPVKADMAQVRRYVQQAISDVYQHETPETLAGEGVEVVFGQAQFLDARTIQVGERTLSAKKFILATGAHPFIPPIPGLSDVPYLTYLDIFDNVCLPERFMVLGAGPIGAEIAQAYQRLGSQVILIDIGLLPNEEPEVAEVMGKVFAAEGIQFVQGLGDQVRQEGREIVVNVEAQEFHADMLLAAVGRRANITGLALDKAGVIHAPQGIEVDKAMRTNVKHIYAIGDCVKGNHQFTHVAGWQGVQAARNALLPGNSNEGFNSVVPWATFTDPEVAHVGLTETQAQAQYGDAAVVTHWPMEKVDRAVAENDQAGFMKVVHTKSGKILGATIVAKRAGEVISEFALAIKRNLKLVDLANVIHPYPTYSVGVMQLAGDVALDGLLAGSFGKVILGVAKLTR